MLIPPTEKPPGPFLNENIYDFIYAILIMPEEERQENKKAVIAKLMLFMSCGNLVFFFFMSSRTFVRDLLLTKHTEPVLSQVEV